MRQHPRSQADEDEREIERHLRAMPRRTMSPARRDEIVLLLCDAEGAEATPAASPPWWRMPVPLWRAAAASVAFAGASVAIALGMSRITGGGSQVPDVEFAVHESAAPAAIIFVSHDWSQRDRLYLGSASIRGWRFIPIEHGEALQ